MIWASSVWRKEMVICKNCFHVRFLEFQSHSKHKKNHFDVCLNKLVLERIQVISLSGFMLILTRMWIDICMSCMSRKLQSGHMKHLQGLFRMEKHWLSIRIACIWSERALSGLLRRFMLLATIDPDFLEMNDRANFNCICRLPPSLIMPTSVLGFKCLQERVGYLQKLSSCKISGISKSFQAQKPFWCLFKQTYSRKNSSDLFVRFYVDFDKNVKRCLFACLVFQKGFDQVWWSICMACFTWRSIA